MPPEICLIFEFWNFSGCQCYGCSYYEVGETFFSQLSINTCKFVIQAVKAQIERIEEASRAVEAEASAQDATTQLTTVESELAELRRNQERQVTLGRQETERKVHPRESL